VLPQQFAPRRTTTAFLQQPTQKTKDFDMVGRGPDRSRRTRSKKSATAKHTTAVTKAREKQRRNQLEKENSSRSLVAHLPLVTLCTWALLRCTRGTNDVKNSHKLLATMVRHMVGIEYGD
jgi:hypothetical protein